MIQEIRNDKNSACNKTAARNHMEIFTHKSKYLQCQVIMNNYLFKLFTNRKDIKNCEHQTLVKVDEFNLKALSPDSINV